MSSDDQQPQLVFRNASWLMLSQLLTWGLSTAESVVIPRQYGPAAIGNLQIALSLWAIVALIVGFGTDLALNRRVAAQQGSDTKHSGAVAPINPGELIGSVLALRVAAHVVGFAALAAFVLAAGYSKQVLALVLIFGIAGLAEQVASVFDAVLYGLQEISISTRIGIAIRVVETAVVLTMVFSGFDFEQVMTVAIAGALASVVFSYKALQRRWPFRMRSRWAVAVTIVRDAAPIFVNRLARDLYVQLDVVILSFLATERVVGWYAASDVLFGTLLFIPNIVGTAIFPAIVKADSSGTDSGAGLTRRGFNLLLITVMPLGLGVVAVGDQVIRLIYGQRFDGAGTVFQLFGVVIILTSLNTLLGQHLIATRRERKLTYLMAVIFVVAVPFDIALISWTISEYGNGALGAAGAYILTEALMFVGGYRLLETGTLGRSTARLAIRAVAAGLIMFAVVFPLREQMLVVPVLAGGVVYGVLVVLFRLVNKEDWSLFRSLIPNSVANQVVVRKFFRD